MLLLGVWPGFALIAVFSSVIYRTYQQPIRYTNGEDVTTVVVSFCRQSQLGCTDMGLQQNMDKMPNFASLSNYTYQIDNTLNACVKYMFCILCIVVTMSFLCLSPNKISVLFCKNYIYILSHSVTTLKGPTQLIAISVWGDGDGMGVSFDISSHSLETDGLYFQSVDVNLI